MFTQNFKFGLIFSKSKFLWIFLSSLFLLLLSLVFTTSSNPQVKAAGNLNLGDVYIVTVNSDYTFLDPAPDPSVLAFEFVSRVDLDAGTQIYFTDKGWDGSLSTPFWRVGGEGALRYTVPGDGLSAGSVVGFSEADITSLPTSGNSTWDMFSIDSSTGVLSLATSSNNSFNLSTSGDNILIFQGEASSPNFVFGIGFGNSSSWRDSGNPTTNNSWLPNPLTTSTDSVVTLNSQDNHQYNCTEVGMYAVGFVGSITNLDNYNSSNSPSFTSSNCSFDAIRPRPKISQPVTQGDPTSNAFIVLEIGFGEEIDASSFNSNDLVIQGVADVEALTDLGSGVWQISLTAAQEGQIGVDLPEGRVLDLAGNPNLDSQVIDNSVVYDTTQPGIPSTPDLVENSDSGVSSEDNITNETNLIFSGVCESEVGVVEIRIEIQGVGVYGPEKCIDNIYTIGINEVLADGEYQVRAYASDSASNNSELSEPLDILIDTQSPYCNLYGTPVLAGSPELKGYADDNTHNVSININGRSYSTDLNNNEWSLPAGTISPALEADNVYPVEVVCNDLAGNQSINDFNLEVQAVVDLAIEVDLLTSGQILAGDSIQYQISLTNTDLDQIADISEVVFYNLVPEFLTPIDENGNEITTNNAGVLCLNMGPARGLGDFWVRYQTESLLICGFSGLNSLPPQGRVEFAINFVANQDLPEGMEYRVFIYDQNNRDPDNQAISSAVNSDQDPFALNNNSVNRVEYTFNSSDDGEDDSSEANSQPSLENQLPKAPNTGFEKIDTVDEAQTGNQIFVIYTVVGTFLIIASFYVYKEILLKL